jgi:hypothetical protein
MSIIILDYQIEAKSFITRIDWSYLGRELEFKSPSPTIQLSKK